MMHPGRIAALFVAVAVGVRAEDSAPRAKPATSGSVKASPASGESGSVRYASSVDTGFFIADLFLNMLSLGVEIAILNEEAEQQEQHLADPVEDSFGSPYQRRADYGAPAARRARDHEARQGLLFSLGLGGGSLRYSEPNFGNRHGAFDLDFRLGYGFSDRFQLFGDVGVDTAALGDGSDLTSWTFTLRGQTVLLGDREGNGLSVNAGIGLGGLSQSYGPYAPSYESRAGLALAAGLSYDARVTRHFALSPELFYVWHEVPNRPGQAADVANTFGLRLNLLWYLY